ncbi:MAG: endolytic transglycosylase MltG [Bacteroidales bacterium]|nr:endolytic transglycosylase MltG [Bacteroidales bacterium]
MKTWKLLILFVFLLAIIAVGVFGGRWYGDNRKSNFSGKADLYVYPGESVADVLSSIPDSIVLRRRSLSRVMASLSDSDLKPGHYVVEKGKPSVYVPRMLRAGWQTPVNFTLSGMMRQKGAIARKISRQMLIDSSSVVQALNDRELLASYGFTPDDVFSLFIPDTYQVYWTDSMKDILDRQKAAYDAFWTADNLRLASAQGLSPKEVSVVASIVKAESNHEPEYPSIAGVYLNRLHQGMRLQADPTVAFCFDYEPTRILYKHLEVDSPYNTYLHEGLPPGPICVPDKPSLNAVLNPDRHGYLYFCASAAMDGTHKFASTLSEHNRNAREFQRALDLRRFSGN